VTTPQVAFLPRNALSFLALSFALLSLLSCAPKEQPPDTSVKEPATEAAVTLPTGAMPLSAVLKSVENAGYAPVVSVELEKDHWEIKAYRSGQLLQLKVGLLAGDIVPAPPPTLEKPLSEIVKGMEDQGYGPILDIEHSAGEAGGGSAWEIEGYKGKAAVTVSVEPASGKITQK